MPENKKGSPRNPGDKWRREFGNLFKAERERRPELARSDSPDEGYLTEIETFKSVPDLAYLFRLMIRFRELNKPLPAAPRLHLLLVRWTLARIEAMYEQLGFREQVLEDFEKPRPPKRERRSREEYRRDKEEFGAVLEEYERRKPRRPKDNDFQSKDDYRSAFEAYEKRIEEAFTENFEPAEVRDHFMKVLSGVEEKLREEVERAESERGQVGALPTLDLFPDKFERITVVVGDYFGKINRLPEHISELFRKSQSFINLHHLLRLGLPQNTEIMSDHLFLQLSEDERAQELGDRHLLVIGSPSVNSVSRDLVLKKSLVFNFVYGEKTYNLGEDFYDSINTAGLLETRAAVEVFYRMMETAGEINVDEQRFVDRGVRREDRVRIRDKVLRLRAVIDNDEANHDYVTELFTPKRMFSPLRPTLPDCASDDEKESAIISLGVNPWSQRLGKGKPHAVIAVCGVNRISTAKALKALSDKDNLSTRPLGGLLEVTKFLSGGPKRVTKSTYEWLDEGYEAGDLLARIDEAAANFDAAPLGFREYFGPEVSAAGGLPGAAARGGRKFSGKLLDYRRVLTQFTEGRR